MSLALGAWRVAATLLAPLLPLHLALRARRGREWPSRLRERRGEGAARPPGRLFWIHAASVGESLSVLPVIEAMAARDPGLHLLVTTGTVTSAELLARRLPEALRERVTHRFVPLDVPAWVARFLDGWRPDAAAFVESELWPNLLADAARRGLPMALVNARIGARSFARWRRMSRIAATLLGGFRVVLARSEEDRARLVTLGVVGARCLGDLKLAAPPLPAEEPALAALRAAIGDRPVFLAASTHPGEEAMAAAAHRALAGRIPGLLTVIAPRHPDRGAALAAALGGDGPPVPRRSQGALPGTGDGLYLADTLGELGLFYRLAGVALVGGSLVPHGGHNPLEPARLGCPVLVGPHTANFREATALLLEAGGAVRLAGPEALAPAVADVLGEPARAKRLADAAAQVVAGQSGLPDLVATALLGLLPADPRDRARGTPPGREGDGGTDPAGAASMAAAGIGVVRMGSAGPGATQAAPPGRPTGQETIEV